MRKFIHQRKSAQNSSWQIIYMDLMTIIMVFFVILWSINQGKSDGISETVGDVTTRMIHLPGDVLFPPGKSKINSKGKDVIKNIFSTDGNGVLIFENNELVKRNLVIHGHTDSVGEKDKNLQLGFSRAFAAYKEIAKYNTTLKDNVVICTHADNNPEVIVPELNGKLSKEQNKTIREAHKKNRRILVEDKIINKFETEE